MMLSIDFIQRLKIFFRLCNRVLRTFTYQQCKVGINIAYIKDERIKRGIAMLHDVYKPNRHWKDIELWKDVTEEQWNDWVWQLTNTIKTLDDLKKVINLTPEEEEGVKISTKRSR